MIIDIFLIIVSIIISMIGSVYIYLNRENLGNKVIVTLNIFLFLCMGIFFLASFYLSTHVYFQVNIALTLWELSILFWMLSTVMLSLLQKFVIKFEEKTILTSIFFFLMIGLIMGLTYISNSFTITLNENGYIFIFQNLVLLFFLISYNITIIAILCYNLIKHYPQFRDKKSGKMLSILTFQFCITISIYSIYIVAPNIVFKYLYAVIYLIGSCFASYYTIRKPFLLIELTNRIYDFIIFHRSGILLYSYNFETGEETDESLLKGSILIGINHILSNFINKKEQLGLIKMQNRDIILEYDNNHGYAILLTTNHKNAYIDKAVSNFMIKFTGLNKEKLQNLTGLIDVSEFRNAKEIILEFFEPFVIKD